MKQLKVFLLSLLLVVALITGGKAIAQENTVELDLSKGDIVITESGYQIGTPVEDTEDSKAHITEEIIPENKTDISGDGIITYSGNYIIVSGDVITTNTISVESGTHEIILNGVTIEADEGNAFYIAPDAAVNLTLNGKNILKSAVSYSGIQTTGAVLNINGSDSDSLTAIGGDKAAGIGGGSNQENGTVSIYGGKITATGGTGGAGIGGGNNSTSYKDPYHPFGGTIVINGGIIDAKGGSQAAGIGGGNHGDGGQITLSGGSITASGGGGGAGIGSGNGSSETKGGEKGPGDYTGGIINILGDVEIRAYGGGNAAGIGGGMYADSGVITISGGTIHEAIAGSGTSGSLHHGAAGIGGGYQGYCDITITDGDIYLAQGSFSGAGIGSGGSANSESRANPDVAAEASITINGGTIHESIGGEHGGAGIGSGAGSGHIEIEISDGIIISATGSDGGAGIGSGVYDNSRKYSVPTETYIDIFGGTIVKASGGADDTRPIGNGSGNKAPDWIHVNVNLDKANAESLYWLGLDYEIDQHYDYDGEEHYPIITLFGLLENAEIHYSFTEGEKGADYELTERPGFTEPGTDVYIYFNIAQTDEYDENSVIGGSYISDVDIHGYIHLTIGDDPNPSTEESDDESDTGSETDTDSETDTNGDTDSETNTESETNASSTSPNGKNDKTGKGKGRNVPSTSDTMNTTLYIMLALFSLISVIEFVKLRKQQKNI